MPISPIVLQRRHAELGRIRLGNKGPSGAPQKLAAFRFTSPSESYIKDLETLYGGTCRPWDNGGKPEFEVYTEASVIDVIAVKGGLSQWLETWSGGGCIHRCDGETNAQTNDKCDPKDRAHLAARPTTRLSLMLPELDAMGVWRMESHGWNAAAEIPAVAELAQYVGDLVPAVLHLVERRSVKDGKTSRFVVPVLDLRIGVERLREIVAEKSGTAPLQLEGGQRPALESGPSPTGDAFVPYFEQVAAATATEQLAGIWDRAKGAGLVGPTAPATDRAQEFLATWKARAHQLKDAAEAPADQPQPDAEGIVDADWTEAPADAPDAGGNEDAIWHQVLAAADTKGWGLDQVSDDFKAQMGGLLPDDASAQELRHYLGLLTAESAA